MGNLTKHGERRIAERIGASNNAAQRNVKKALHNGIKIEETTGALFDWLMGKKSMHRGSYTLTIYKNNLYIFSCTNTLITVYPLPDHLKNDLEQYVSADRYDRYTQSFRDDEIRKNDKQMKAYLEKKAAFERQVLLNDVRSFVKDKFSVEITGLACDSNFMRIYYAPTDYSVPDLSELAAYIRKHTIYTRVKFCHLTDSNGKRVYRRKYAFNPDEDELVYSV